MTSSPPTLVGYNNNVRYRGMRFHIQTEDSGITRPHITTHLFADGGYVIKSLRTDYAEHVGHPERAAMVQRMMRDQHRAMALDLRDGKLDATIERLAPPPAGEPEEAPASVPTPSELAATPSTFAPSSSPAPAEAPCAAAPDTVIPPASGAVGSITERPPSQPFSPDTALPLAEAMAQAAAPASEPSGAPAGASREVEAPDPAVAQAEPVENLVPAEAPASESAAKGSASRRPARRPAGESPKNGRGSDKPASSRAASSRPSASSRRSQSTKPASSKRQPNPVKQSGQRPSLALDATTLEQLAGTRKAQSSSRPPGSRGGKSRPAPSSRSAASARASKSTTRAASSRPPNTRASAAPLAASTAAGASSSRPPSSRGGASTRATSQRPTASEGKPARVTPTAPPASAPASSRRAGRPAASLPKKPSGESLFGPLPQESLDDAILSYVAKSKNGPPTRRGSK